MKGAAYPAVTNDDVLKIKIPFPPLSLQNEFAVTLENIEQIKEKLQKSENEINQLFDSLLQKAFNGELVI